MSDLESTRETQRAGQAARGGARAGWRAGRAGWRAGRRGWQVASGGSGGVVSRPRFWLILFLALVLYVIFETVIGSSARSASASYPSGSAIPKEYWPIYVAAGGHYGVSPYVLASIHKIESEFGRSNLPGVKSGANFCGAAGPMQFGVVGVPPYNASPTSGCSAGDTWRGYWRAYEPIADARPREYPVSSRDLLSCDPVLGEVGCVYDTFDAVAAAAALLKASGAEPSIDAAGTRAAILAYNHSDAYANEVLAQAREWDRMASPAEGAGPAGPIGGGAKGIVDAAAKVAEPFGTFVVSGYRPGDPKDHGSNNAGRAARDIAVAGVDALAGPPPPELDRAIVALGEMLGRNYSPGTTIIDTFASRGFRIQVIWRTKLYGGHMGHIHIGACRIC